MCFPLVVSVLAVQVVGSVTAMIWVYSICERTKATKTNKLCVVVQHTMNQHVCLRNAIITAGRNSAPT